MADFNNQNDISNQRVIGDTISRGAWGGDRSAVAQAINEVSETAKAQKITLTMPESLAASKLYLDGLGKEAAIASVLKARQP